MNAEEYAQAALDQDGYLVVGSDIPHKPGDIIDDGPHFSFNQRLRHKTVVIGESNAEENRAQQVKLLGYTPTWRAPFYYRVTAE